MVREDLRVKKSTHYVMCSAKPGQVCILQLFRSEKGDLVI